MTEKTAQQINRMKEQTIGVEIEMNNITRKAAAKLAADFFGTNRYEDTPQRLLHLERMGCTGARVEIPAGREHRRLRQRKVRTGHTDPALRRHRNPAGACEKAQEGRSAQ